MNEYSFTMSNDCGEVIISSLTDKKSVSVKLAKEQGLNIQTPHLLYSMRKNLASLFYEMTQGEFGLKHFEGVSEYPYESGKTLKPHYVFTEEFFDCPCVKYQEKEFDGRLTLTLFIDEEETSQIELYCTDVLTILDDEVYGEGEYSETPSIYQTYVMQMRRIIEDFHFNKILIFA